MMRYSQANIIDNSDFCYVEMARIPACRQAGNSLSVFVEMMGIEPMSKIVHLKQSTSLVYLLDLIER
jgi:hypothetical protein